MRSAGALAKRQLSTPSNQVGLQLSRVATSAYRLLDPRQREDANQRIYVGRIMPNALQWAGQTSFYHPRGPRSPFGGGRGTDDEICEMLDSEGDRSQSDAEMWASRLNHDDLVPAKRRPFGWREMSFMVVLAGFAIGTVLGIATLGSRSPSPSANFSAVSPNVDPAPLDPSPSRDTFGSEPIGTDTADSPILEGVLEQPSNVAPTTELSWDPDPFAVVDSSPEPSSATDPAHQPHEEKVGQSETPGAMAAGTQSPIGPGKPIEPPFAARHPVPGKDAVRASRERLIALLSDRDIAIPSRAPDRPIAEIESLLPNLSAGSPDDWAARVMVCELAWLVEDLSAVRGRLEILRRSYDVAIDPLLADTFISACDLAHLPETQEHLLANGLRFADELLVNESPQLCIRLVQAVRPAAELLESESSLEYLDQFWHSALQMERLAATSQRIIEQATQGEAEPQNAGIVGRYYCLMLRKWDTGMPWLTKVSDPRIAGVARQELLLNDASSVDDRVAVAQRWLSLADRLDGRSSDSIRLHALDLLDQAAKDSSELRKLEIERAMDEVREIVPPFLRVETTTSGSVTRSPVPPRTTEVAEPAAKGKPGLSGRIRVDGNDVGVQLDYQLDVAFTQAVLDSIEQNLGRDLPAMTIQLVGEFELEQPGTVLVSRAESRVGVEQTIQIDGTPVHRPEGPLTTDVVLEAGVHRVEWSIEAEQFSQLYLRLRDAESGERLSVVQPSDSAAPSLRTILTVAMVRATE